MFKRPSLGYRGVSPQRCIHTSIRSKTSTRKGCLVKCSRLQSLVAIAGLITSLIAHVPFAAGGERLKSVSALTVVDAHGTEVGPLISAYAPGPSSSPVLGMVAFRVDHQPFALIVSRLQISGGSSGPYFFSPNCSGEPWIEGGTTLIPLGAVSAPGHTVYAPEPGATRQIFNPFDGSRLDPDGTCQAFNGPIGLLAARPLVELDTLFTPPFSVE